MNKKEYFHLVCTIEVLKDENGELHTNRQIRGRTDEKMEMLMIGELAEQIQETSIEISKLEKSIEMKTGKGRLKE